jgi:amino acid transporter
MRRTSEAPGLVRAISRVDLTAAVVNAVIGSSVFAMPSRQAELVGTGSPLSYLIAGVGMLMLYLCFAEVASRFSDAGGPYLYVREGFGPLLGFQAGWLTFWLRVTAISANVNVFVVYGAQLLPWIGTPSGRAATMLAIFAVIAAINVRGVRQATWAIDLFTVAKLAPLALLVALGASRVSAATLATQAVAQPQWTQAVLLLVFAYGGFESALIPAGEATQPRRDTPFALLAGLAIVAALYISVQVVVVGTVPHVAGVKAPVAAACGVLVGQGGAVLASLAALISTWGLAMGSVLQAPRLILSMAERGELPGPLARIHPVFRTPECAILTYVAVSLAFALYGDFEWNAQLSAIVRLVVYGLTCAALPFLRGRESSTHSVGFQLPAATIVVPGALGFCLWLLATRTFAQAWILGALMAVGGLVWVTSRLTSRGAGAQ